MTPADLKAAVGAAKPGSTLQIPPGNYGIQKIYGLKDVALRPDPGAVFDQLVLQNCTDIDWQGGQVLLPSALATGTGVKVVTLANCHGGRFAGATIKGALATLGGPEDSPTSGNHLINGRPAGMAVSLEMKTSDMVIEGLDCSQFFKGVIMSTITNMTIRRNRLHDFRATGFAGDCENTVLEFNDIRNCHPWHLGLGDHCEAAHFYNVQGATAPKIGVTFRFNVIDQDQGDAFNIAVGFEGKNGFGFDNAVVDGNWILNGSAKGVNFDSSHGSITNNRLYQTSGDKTAAPTINIVPSTEKQKFPPGVFIDGNLTPDTYGNLIALKYAEMFGRPAMKNTITPTGIASPDVLARARAAAKAAMAAP